MQIDLRYNRLNFAVHFSPSQWNAEMRRSEIIKSGRLISIKSAIAYFVLGCLLFTLFNSAAAQEQLGTGAQNPSSEAFEIRSGVIVDRANSSVFIMHPKAGIESVGLATGETRWTTTAAGKPLLVSGNILLAQIATDTAQLDLAILDIANKGAVIKRISVVLPEGIIASIDDRGDRSFDVRAVEVNGKIYIRWSERRHKVAAVESLQKEPVVQTGFVSINLKDGTYARESDETERLFESLLPDLIGEERIRRVEDTQFRSDDGLHAMTSKLVADNNVWEKYEWSIWKRDTGELVGRFRDSQRYSPFGVMSSILIQEVKPYERRQDGEMVAVPLSVRAVDLRKEKEIWRRQIRDTVYRGPLPP